MCDICKRWKAKKITSKDAMLEIGEKLQAKPSARAVDHLLKLSEKILDHDVPLTESDPEADQRWWDSTHPEKDSE